jgi:hypothetical protein
VETSAKGGESMAEEKENQQSNLPVSSRPSEPSEHQFCCVAWAGNVCLRKVMILTSIWKRILIYAPSSSGPGHRSRHSVGA